MHVLDTAMRGVSRSFSLQLGASIKPALLPDAPLLLPEVRGPRRYSTLA
jgi:hypothetical protein